MHVIITDFFLGWTNAFSEGRVGCKSDSDHAFYSIVTFSIFSFCRSTLLCTAAALSSTALFLLCVTVRLCFWSCD